MTPRPLSTSGPELRRYLRTLAVALGVLVAALVGITATGYQLGLVDATNHAIYRYQRAKLNQLPRIDIAFVGDSSLGNAINAALFSNLSGRTTANLALNGSFGAGGTYNMIRRLIENHQPQLVIVMQTIDVMHRSDAFPGFYFSATPIQLLTTSPIQILELYFNLKAAIRVLGQVTGFGVADTAKAIENDYNTQRGYPINRPPPLEVEMHPLAPDMIARTQLDYIQRIAELCRRQGVTCIYAHGPIFDGYCRQAGEYIANLNERIRSAGLEVVRGTPLCMPEMEVGNSVDHVRSDLKDLYTRRYFDLLRANIQPATETE